MSSSTAGALRAEEARARARAGRGPAAVRASAVPAASWGDARGALIAGVLTLVTTISYGAVAGAPLGAAGAAAMTLSGLVAAALGAAVATAVGRLPQQVFSPRASVAVVIAAAARAFGAVPAATPEAMAHAVALLAACLLLAALLQLAFAALRLGALIRLIPHSVTAGLVMALGLKLAASQLPWLLASGDAMHAWAPLAVGAATLAIIAVCRLNGQAAAGTVAGLLVGMAAAVLVERLAPGPALPHLAAIDIARGPLLSPVAAARIAIHGIGLASWPGLLGFAAVIALVNAIETLTCAMQLEDMGVGRFDPNRALLAAACGSLASLAGGGLPVAGSMLTSAAAVQAGARSRGAAFGAAAIVAVGTLALGSFVARVPLAVVATLMLTVAAELAYYPALELLQRQRRHADGQGRHGELIVVGVVCALLLGGDILVAVAGGLAVATALAFVRMRAGLVRRQYDASEAELPEAARRYIERDLKGEGRVIELGQPLFFATAEAAVRVIERSAARLVVLDLGPGGLDLTAAKALARCAGTLAASGRRLAVVGDVAGLEAELRPCQVSASVADAIERGTAGDAPSRRKAVVDAADARVIPAELVEHAVSLLAPRIGPLARHVVRRAVDASTHRDHFAQLAASHLDERVEREAFLVRMRTWKPSLGERR